MRTAVFIDGGYFEKVARDLGAPRIDYAGLSTMVGASDEVLRTYYYDCLPYRDEHSSEEEVRRYGARRSFFTALEHLQRFEVRAGKLARRGVSADGTPIFEQKRVDVLLAVDMLEMVHTGAVERVVLISGDSDFVPVVRVVKRRGVIVTLWFGSGCHDELKAEVDERNPFTAAALEKIRR